MNGIINYEVFLVTGILLNLIPGSDTMYIIARSISQGRRAGVISVFGILTGSLIHTLLAAFGLSVILTKSVVLFNLVKMIGLVYLVYLGIKMISSKTSIGHTTILANELNLRKIYVQGILTSITNPKVALFFISFLPQFVDPIQGGSIAFIILGLTFTFTGGVWCTLVALFSSYATNKIRNNSKIAVVLNKITGIVFIAMGLNLLRAKADR